MILLIQVLLRALFFFIFKHLLFKCGDTPYKVKILKYMLQCKQFKYTKTLKDDEQKTNISGKGITIIKATIVATNCHTHVMF